MNTICAISTATGVGAVAIIRVSGSEAISLVDKLFRGRHPLAEQPANTVRFGEIVSNGEVLDQVLCTIFRSPHSFTGEDTVEIACHGSRYIQQTILQALIDAGCRMARPGEFTQRAFLNGKMDLTEAEAVADLIAAGSRAEKDLALSHLKGRVASRLHELREQLLTLTSLLELELDFADHEELEFADRSELATLAVTIRLHLTELIDSYQLGNAVKNGIPVAIVGAPNVGKSTLLNALLGDDKAIVSNIAGTTRDIVEDVLYIHGLQFRFLDTAGLRETTDEIETIGIRRALKAAADAQIILYVTEGENELVVPTQWADKPVLIIRNKADIYAYPHPTKQNVFLLSAKHDRMDALKEALYEAAGVRAEMREQTVVISSARHYEALVRAREAILRVQQGMQEGLSGELLDLDLQDCLSAIGEITGEITNDEVLGNIFSKFCIGK